MKLVVVTKFQPIEVVRSAIEAGAVLLGENYAEEGVTKIQSLQNLSAVEWHMIGHVQSRKAPLVAGHFNFMHSLDSLKLAKKLDRFCAEAGRALPVLLEFNVGGEDSKGGWEAVDETRWEDLLPEVSELLAIPNLQVRGLMSMPPLGMDAEFSRPYFQKLRQIGRIVLPISIQSAHNRRACCKHPSAHRAALTSIFPMPDDTQRRQLRLQRREFFSRGILARIIDEDHLVRAPLEDRGDLARQQRGVAGLVMHGHDNAELNRFGQG